MNYHSILFSRSQNKRPLLFTIYWTSIVNENIFIFLSYIWTIQFGKSKNQIWNKYNLSQYYYLYSLYQKTSYNTYILTIIRRFSLTPSWFVQKKKKNLYATSLVHPVDQFVEDIMIIFGVNFHAPQLIHQVHIISYQHVY